MVPEGWLSKTVGDCFKFEGGTQPPKSVFEYSPKPGYIRMIQTRDFKSDKYATYIPVELAKNRFVETDIMIGRYGPPVFQIYRGKSGAYNVALIKAVPLPGVDADFAFYFICNDDLYQKIDGLSRRSAGQSGVEMDFLKSYPMNLPPLPEQQKIAEILGTWDKAIETTEALLANARTQKRALMQALLTGTRRFPEFEGQPWREVPIGNVATEVSVRNAGGGKLPVISCTKSIGFVNSLDYFKKQVFSDDLSGYKIVTRNQIAYPSNHIEEGSIGLQDLYDRAIVSPIYTVFQPSSKIDPKFMLRVLKSDRHRQLFASSTSASVDRRGSLRWKAFSLLPVPLPTIAEQQAINAVLDSADELIARYECDLDHLRTEKKSLMQQLLTGKRRVVIATD